MALARKLRGDPSRVVCVIGDGSLAEGMALESEMSRAHAKTMTADRFAERRRGVQERGRSQDRNQDE